MPQKPPLAQPDYQKKDDAFFDLLLRLRVIVRAVADHRFFEGNSGHILKRYCDEGLLVADQRAYPGNLSGYRPTTKTCAKYGSSKDRARPLRGAALDLALGLNVFCALEENARMPLVQWECKQILGNAAPAAMIPHVVTDELGFPAVFRVFQAAKVDAVRAVDQARQRLDDLRRHPALGAWIDGREYGIAMLAPSISQRDALRRAIRDSQLDQQAAVILGLGPTVETLHSVLVELRKGQP